MSLATIMSNPIADLATINGLPIAGMASIMGLGPLPTGATPPESVVIPAPYAYFGFESEITPSILSDTGSGSIQAKHDGYELSDPTASPCTVTVHACTMPTPRLTRKSSLWPEIPGPVSLCRFG